VTGAPSCQREALFIGFGEDAFLERLAGRALHEQHSDDGDHRQEEEDDQRDVMPARSVVREMAAFIACVRDGKNPPAGGLDGQVPVVMGKAASLSAEQNRPVKLSEIKA
jgi:predicted dehydrogenase